MASLRKDTLIVVTDSEKALFIRNLTDHQDPNFEVVGEERQENPPDSVQAAGKPGRRADTGYGHRSALDETDWHELAKERFAKELSDILYAEAHKGAFERLVIAASPQVLGVLRNEMHKEVVDKIVSEISKTLTNHPIDKIEKIVKTELDAL